MGAELIEWFVKVILLIDYEKTSKMIYCFWYLWTIVNWIVSWLIESVMIRRYIVRGFAYCLNGNAELILSFAVDIMLLDL